MATDLLRNVVDALPDGELERKLALGRPLRVKLGVDPTSVTFDLTGVRASLGVPADVESFTYADMRRRQELIQKRLRSHRSG